MSSTRKTRPSCSRPSTSTMTARSRIVEDARVRLGIIDANLEEHAKEPGVKGAIADVAHRALDKLDND